MLDINVMNFVTVGIISILFAAILKLFTQLTGLSIPFVS